MNRVIPGFGTTLSNNKIDRQLELQELMKRKEEKEKQLHDSIIEKLYVEPTKPTKEQK